MRENDFTGKNCDKKTQSCPEPGGQELLEHLKNNGMDGRSIDIMRKLAFLRLVEASKRHHMEKIQGKDPAVLEKTGKTVSDFYSDYKNLKNWAQTR